MIELVISPDPEVTIGKAISPEPEVTIEKAISPEPEVMIEKAKASDVVSEDCDKNEVESPPRIGVGNRARWEDITNVLGDLTITPGTKPTSKKRALSEITFDPEAEQAPESKVFSK